MDGPIFWCVKKPKQFNNQELVCNLVVNFNRKEGRRNTPNDFILTCLSSVVIIFMSIVKVYNSSVMCIDL